MTEFANLRVVALNGLEAPYNHLDKRSPYHPDWYDNELARAVTQSGVRRVRWEFNGESNEVAEIFMGGIALDADSDLLVVIEDKTDRLRVINPDGSINHEIVLPLYVEIATAGFQPTCYPVADVHEVVELDGRVAIGMHYRPDMIERRFYDPAKREWQERSTIYRN